MQEQTKVTAKVPSYETFLAFYSKMQDIEKFYSLAEIVTTVNFIYLTLIANNLELFPELKIKIMAEKLTFLIEFVELLDKIRPE